MENIDKKKAFLCHKKDLRQCGHILSAGYDKHFPIGDVITNFSLYTHVITHVDDELINLQTVMQRGFDQCIIGLYFPTVGDITFRNELHPKVDNKKR